MFDFFRRNERKNRRSRRKTKWEKVFVYTRNLATESKLQIKRPFNLIFDLYFMNILNTYTHIQIRKKCEGK